MGFSRQEYWSGLPFPSPGDLPNPGIEPRSPTLQEDSSQTELSGKPNQGLQYFFLNPSIKVIWASLIAQLVKNPSTMLETPVGFLGQEDPLEKG